MLMGFCFGLGILVGLCAAVQGAALGSGPNPFLICGVVTSSILLTGIGFICAVEVVWITVDWIRILCDSFPDGNGVALLQW